MKIEKCPCCGCVAEFHSVPYDKNPSEDKWAVNCFKDKTIASCPSCGTWFTKEALLDSELNAFYSSLYQGTSTAKANLSSLYEFYPRFFSQTLFLKTHVNLFDGIRILEIGPNQVSALPAISLFCKPKYCYFDQLEFPIIKKFGGKRLGQYFSQEYFESNTKADKFDLVIMSHSLEHINPVNLRDTIKNLHAALKLNGHLFIEVPDQIKGKKPPPHTLFFTIEGLKILLESEGFRATGLQSIEGKSSVDAKTSNRGGVLQATENTNGKNGLTLSQFVRKSTGLILKPFMLRFMRPVYIRLILKNGIKETGVPYSDIAYLRMVAKKSG
jgi:SAM-dependent methyltransferase